MRLPTRIHFPFGYTIKVRQVTKRELDEIVGEDAVAGWVGQDQTIYLTRSRTTRQKRADLAHELSHAVVDFGSHLLSSGIAKHD